MSDMSDNELLRKAKEAARDAYAPYSGFGVGAALETDEGRLYTGANVENASYGLSICAERVAVFKAVSDGNTHFKRIAVAAQNGEDIVPCGACLQVLSEFGPDMDVITTNAGGEILTRNIKDLIPIPFKQSKR